MDDTGTRTYKKDLKACKRNTPVTLPNTDWEKVPVYRHGVRIIGVMASRHGEPEPVTEQGNKK
eukprot:754295-Hanusia_phi.AAC.1